MAGNSNDSLVLVGDGAFAQIAYEYFEHDSLYDVVGFCVESEYRERDDLFGVPVVDFETVTDHFTPDRHDAFVAITYNQLNRLRERLHTRAKDFGYELATYVSSDAFVWRNVTLGENCFIFEENNIQPWVEIGDGVVFWSGNHVGHHSIIGDHCFVSSHVTISGYVTIGTRCFLGVNSAIAHEVSIGDDCLVGAGTTITHDTGDDEVYAVNATEIQDYTAREYFGVDEE